MSSIDERIVRMTFDNQKFMEKAKQTINVLANLKTSLKLDKVTGGFEKIQNSVNKLKLSPVANDVQQITDRFSTMGIVGFSAIQKITQQAVVAGEKLVSSFTIDPIKLGFQEYETQINAVQTILANTESKGSTLQDVNSALDELNKYADMTIYNFTEMTRNIGTFTAAGVDLDTSVSAIKGIANLAAVSGSTSQQASTAMYQLSQALAAGTVKLMDWNSVVNAGMGGQVFQDALKETARVHGIAIDQMIEDNGSFRETLQEGWLTSEVLTETLSKFTGDLTEAQLLSMGYTNEQADAILKMGVTANDAATKVKTFTQLMDTLMEAAQSGWTQTWETIIGDFEEAKAFLTEISDVFSEMINQSSESRNAVLTGWKDLGGRDMLIESLRNSFQALLALMKPIQEAFQEVFPPITAEILLDMTKNLKSFTESLIIGGRTAENIKNVFKAVFSIFKVIGSVALVAAKAIGLIISAAAKVIDILLYPIGDISRIFATMVDYVFQFLDGLEKFASSIASLESVQMLLSTLATLFGTIQNVIGMVYDKVRSLAFALTDNTFDMSALVFSKIADVLSFMASHLNDLIIKTVNFVSSLKDLPVVQGAISKLSEAFNTLRTNVSAAVSVVKDNLVWIFESAKTVLGGYAEKILPYLQSFGEKVKNFLTDVFVNGVPVTEKLGQIFEKVSARVKDINSISFEAIVNKLKELRDKIIEVVTSLDKLQTMKNIFGNMQTGFGEFLSTSSDIVAKVKNTLTEFVTWLRDKIANISLGDVIAAGAGGSLIAFAMSLTKFTNTAADAIKPVADILKGVKNIEDSVAGYIKSLTKIKEAEARNATLTGIAKLIQSVALLAGAIAILANMDPERVKVAAIALGALAGGLIILTTVAARLLSEVNPAVMTSFALTMLGAGASLILMTAALKSISDIPTDKILASLGAMGVLMAELAAFVIAISKFAPTVSSGALSMLAMSVSLMIMAKAIDSVGDLDSNKVIASIGIIALMGLILAALNALAGKGSGKAAAGILAVAVALTLMVNVLQTLGEMDADTSKVGVERLALLLGSVAILFVASKVAGKHAAAAGVAVIAVSAALHLIVSAIYKMAEIEDSTMVRASEVVKKILFVFALITAATSFAGKYGARAGVAIGIMSASMLLLVGAMAVLSGLNPDGLARGLDAVQRIMLMFALIIAATKVSTDASKSMTAIGITIGALVGSLAILSLINPENLFAATTALTMVMGMFALLVASTKLAAKATSTLLIMVAVVGILGVMLRALSDLPAESTLAVAVSLSALLLALSGAAAILQLVNPAAAVAGVLGFLAVVSAVGLLLAALAGINELSGGQAAGFLQNGIPMLEAIGAAIGGFVGSLAGALAGAFAGTALAELGNGLSNFMTNIQGFLDGAKNVDQSSVDGIGSLVSMILMLTGAEFLNNIAGLSKLLGGNVGGFLSGKSGLESFGDELIVFADKMTSFVDSIAEVDSGNLEKSKQTVSSVIGLLQSIGAEGGVEGFLKGSSSEAMGNLGGVLPKLAEGIKKYAEAVSDLTFADYAAIATSIEPIKNVFTLLDSIKEEGGWVDFVNGSSSEAIGNLARVLPGLGRALVSYSSSLTGEGSPDYDAIAESIEPCKNLFTLLEFIRDEGGVVDWWNGSASEAIGNLAEHLPALGEAILSYSNSLTGETKPDYNAIAASIEPVKTFFGLLEFIKDEGGVVDWWSGSSSEALGNLADKLPYLGAGLAAYSLSLSNASIEKIDSSIPAVKSLVEITQSLDNENFLSFISGSKIDTLNHLSTALPLLGSALTLYSASISGANFENIDASLAGVQTLTDAMIKLGDESMLTLFESNQSNAFKNFASALPLVGAGLRGYSNALQGYSKETVDGSLDAITSLSTVAGNLKPGGVLLSVFGEGGKAPLEAFSENLPKLGIALKEFGTNLGEFEPTVAESAATTLKSLIEVSNNLRGEGGIDAVLKNLFGGEEDQTKFENLSNNLKELANALNAFGNNLNTENFANLDVAMTGVQKVVDFIRSLDGLKTDAIDPFVSALSTYGDFALTNFSTTIAAIAPDVTSNLELLKDGLATVVPEIADLASTLKDSLGNDNLSFTGQGKKIGETFTSGLKDSLSTGFANAVLIVATGATSLVNNAHTVFSNALGSFQEDGRQIGFSVANGLKSVSFFSVGHDMMSGLATGIRYGSSLAITAAADAADAAYKAAKEVLVINSPSKKFAELGMGCDEGLALGMHKYSGLVEEAGKGIADESVNSARIALTALNDLADFDFDSEPTIKPVLDMSSIEDGSKKMNALLDTNYQTIRLRTDVSSKMSESASGEIAKSDINRQLNFDRDTGRIVSAIDGLERTLAEYSGDSYYLDGITYDDGSAISNALGEIARATRIERRS